MKTYIIILVIILSSCTKKIYVSSDAYVVGIYENYIQIRYNCENVNNPACYAILDVSKKNLSEVYLGQKLTLKSPD